MPFCPKCRFEYRPEISHCPDCDERLVASLPSEEDKNESYTLTDGDENDDWVPLARMISMQYAEMVMEALHSEDIPAILRAGTISSGHLGMSSFGPGDGAHVTIFVSEEHVVRADEIGNVILGEMWEKSKLFDIDNPSTGE